LIYPFNRLRQLYSQVIKLCLGLILALLLTGCAGEVAPTALPTATNPPDMAGTVVSEPRTPLPNPSLTPEADPAHSVAPVITFPGQTPPTGPKSLITPANYGPLPTPPPTLDPKAELFNPGPGKVLPENSLVVGTETGLYLLNPSENRAKLLVGGASFLEPKISPDGQRVAAFRQDPISRRSQPVIVDLGGGIKPVNFDNGGVVLAVAWSPDSKILALTRATDTNNDGLADDFDQTSLVLYEVASGKQSSIGEGGFGAWSADGSWLAYIIPGPTDSILDPTTRQLGRGPNALGVYNYRTKAKRTLLEAKGQSLGLAKASFTPIPPDINLDLRYFKAVAWHPDSKHLTASADASGPNGLRAGVILSVTLDKPTPEVLTAAGDAAGRVSWSPDGKQLAFETLPQYPVSLNSANRVAVLPEVNLETSAPVKTLLGSAATRSETRRPAWSPGSQFLAYLEGDNAILTLAGSEGQNPRHLLAGCLGFDWH
jgi:WD40 repeat protein